MSDGLSSTTTLIDAYGGYLIRNGRTDSTARKYQRALQDLDDWLDGRSLGSLAASDIDVYLRGWWKSFEQRHGRLPENATYRAQITALKGFFGYLERYDKLIGADGQPSLNPLRQIEMPKRVVKPIDWLNRDEDEQLLAFAGTPNEEILVWLLRWTGVRVDEARHLRNSDVDLTWGQQSVRVRVSKTPRGKRTIPLAPELVPRIEAWLAYQRERGLGRPEAPLLATGNGTAMASTYIWRATKRAAYKADVRPVACTCGAGYSQYHKKACPRTVSGEHLSHVSPHTLRRTFGSYLLNRDVPIETVSALLGHTSVAITQKYYAELEDRKVRRDFLDAVGQFAVAA